MPAPNGAFADGEPPLGNVNGKSVKIDALGQDGLLLAAAQSAAAARRAARSRNVTFRVAPEV